MYEAPDAGDQRSRGKTKSAKPELRETARVEQAKGIEVPLSPSFDNSYALLPDKFFARVAPAPFVGPRLIKLNGALAGSLGLDETWLSGTDGLGFLSGQVIAPGSVPIAMAYAGHQFGNFVPQLGDGRAILLGEVLDREGRRFDIQLKGGGSTPFSRGGDGRAALGPVLREYIVSEFMAAVGIPTTRALAAIATGEPVYRESMLPGAVLVRVASSHIRVGTFQFFAARQDTDAVRILADHVIARHYPHAGDTDQPYRGLLEAVVSAQATLVARWLQVGFIHGVMNTDNMAIAGETIDYGPCAFMDTYDPKTVYSSIDRLGRYAYANQPSIALWNLTRLAETLLPILDADEDRAIAIAQEALSTFEPQFTQAYRAGMLGKLGIMSGQDEDTRFANELLTDLASNQVDFTLFFRRLSAAIEAGPGDEPVRSLFVDPTAGDALLARWRARLEREPEPASVRCERMNQTNPAFVPRNHRIEAVISAANEDDFEPFAELLAVLSRPFDDRREYEHYAQPPLEHERVLATFCGT